MGCGASTAAAVDAHKAELASAEFSGRCSLSWSGLASITGTLKMQSRPAKTRLR